METTYSEPPVAALSLQGLLSKIQLTADERKHVDGTVAKISDVLKLGQAITPAQPNQHNQASPLHSEVDRLHSLLIEHPTRENAEAFHNAIVRERDAALTADPINSALRAAWKRLVDSLQPVALEILDRVENLLDSEAAKVRQTIISADAIFGSGGDVSTFDRRLNATRQSIAIERNRVCAETASLAWLHENGFCQNPFQPPAAPKPQPVEEVKLTRGRQRLAIEELAGAE